MPSRVKSVTVVSCSGIRIKKDEKVFVTVKCGKEKFETKKVDCAAKKKKATWKATFKVKKKNSVKDILFKVFDDDLLGQCLAKLDDYDQRGREMPLSLELCDSKGKAIKSSNDKPMKLDVIVEFEKDGDESDDEKSRHIRSRSQSRSSRKIRSQSRDDSDESDLHRRHCMQNCISDHHAVHIRAN